MAKFSDWSAAQDVKDIAERFLDHFPDMFEGFDADGIHFILTKKKKSKVPMKVRAVGYPNDVFGGKPYIVEVYDTVWSTMDDKKRNLSVFHTMCAIPEGGFEEQSKHYGKVRQPEIRMYMREFAACGGVPNWMENPAAKDPMERTADEVADDVPHIDALTDAPERNPVSVDDIANVGTDTETDAAA